MSLLHLVLVAPKRNASRLILTTLIGFAGSNATKAIRHVYAALRLVGNATAIQRLRRRRPRRLIEVPAALKNAVSDLTIALRVGTKLFDNSSYDPNYITPLAQRMQRLASNCEDWNTIKTNFQSD
jgi:hypothetical protein